jgi:hypothetical protein
MQKLIWGFFIALFILDVIKVKVFKEPTKINPVVETVEQVENIENPNTPAVQEVHSKREYSGDKVIIEIGYW